jgi:serine/threonine-protein kinase
MTRRWAALAVLALVVMPAARARAQDRDRAAEADALFREAKQLIEQRRFDQACPKLEESQRLDAAGGTALTLALCHQAEGRLGTAWTDFEAALSFAERDKRADRAKVAKDAMAKLAPILSRLIVRVDPKTAELDGLVVQRDGATIEPTAFGAAVPVDGGEHTIVASAPGHRRVELRVSIAAREERLTVAVPALDPLPPAPEKVAVPEQPAPAKPSAPATSGDAGSSSARTAWTVAAFGVALAGAGATTYFGLQARSAADEAEQLCPRSPCDDQRGVGLNEDARRDAWIATATAGVALAGAAVGVVLLLSRPSSKAPTSTAWSLSWRGHGPALGGSFW